MKNKIIMFWMKRFLKKIVIKWLSARRNRKLVWSFGRTPRIEIDQSRILEEKFLRGRIVSRFPTHKSRSFLEWNASKVAVRPHRRCTFQDVPTWWGRPWFHRACHFSCRIPFRDEERRIWLPRSIHFLAFILITCKGTSLRRAISFKTVAVNAVVA